MGVHSVMAISFTSGEIQINSGADSGTATSAAAGTLVDSSKSWTSSAYINSVVWLTGGTGAGQSRLVISNTTTQLNVGVDWVTTPDVTTTYIILYRLSDVIAAVTQAAWNVSSATKECLCTAPIRLLSGGGLSIIREDLRFTNGDETILTNSGSYFQAGHNPTNVFPDSGTEGGSIKSILVTTGYWRFPWSGKMRLWACNIDFARNVSDITNSFAMINEADYQSSGLEFYDCHVSGVMICVQAPEIIVNTRLFTRNTTVSQDSTFSFQSAPTRFSGNQGVFSPRPSADGIYGDGINGADIIDHLCVTPGAFDLFLFNYNLSQNAVTYLWNVTLTNAWTSALRWYNNTGNGSVYRGYLVALKITDSVGSGVVANVGVFDTNDDGAILTSKSALFPVRSAVVTTDANGEYSGAVGTSEGLPILYAGYTRSSEYVSTETLYAGYTYKVRKYGYSFVELSKSWDERSTESTTLNDNTAVTLSAAAAAALTGIAIVGDTSITLSTSHTALELYDYGQEWAAQSGNFQYKEPLLTTDKINLTLATGIKLITDQAVSGGINITGNVDLTAVANLTGHNITGTLDFAVAGTYVIDDSTITEVTNSSGGAVIINTTGGLSIATNTGPSITINAPSVNTGLDFTGLLSGSQVVVYNNGLTTEIQRNNSTTTTETWSETYSSDQVVDYTILKAGYDPIHVQGVTAGNIVQTVAVQQKVARSYNAGVTFTYSTDGAYAATVFTLGKLMTVQDYYSAMIDSWIANETNTALKNVTFPITPNGANSYSFDDCTLDEADLLQYLYRDGVRYTASGVVTKKYAAILSQGSVGTDVAEIQQVEGAAPKEYTRAGVSRKSWNVPLQTEGGVVDCLIPVYDSTPVTGFDYTGYMVIEYAKAGKYQDRVLAHDVYGTIEDELYVVAVASTESPITGSDPALASPPTITRHAPTVWNGKTFSMTITDSAAGNTAADIAQWVNWNIREENDTAFEGDDPMNYYDAVQDDGTGLWRTRYGLHIGSGFTGCRVVQNDGTTAHSGFSRMESDTQGDYYTSPQTASVTINNITTSSRVQLYDTANSTELYNGIPGATSYVYSETYSLDRTVRVRITDQVGAVAKIMIEAVVGSISTSNYNISYNAGQEADTTYNTNAIDGTAVTGITINDTTDRVEIGIPGGSMTWPQIYAYEVAWLHTEVGIRDDFAFMVAPDTANYLLTGFKIKNTSSPSVPLVITSGYGRDSSTLSSVDLVDTTGGTLIFAPDHVVPYSSGSGLTAGQDARLFAIPLTVGASSSDVFTKALEANLTTE